MVIVWWPIYARLIRGQVQAVKHRDHIQAAVSIGATRSRILRKHVLPLSFTPALINATLDLGQVVILTATLSFLGLGAKPPSPEWGAMITDGAQFFYQWWIAVAPGIGDPHGRHGVQLPRRRSARRARRQGQALNEA